jgi:hypothetical protein
MPKIKSVRYYQSRIVKRNDDQVNSKTSIPEVIAMTNTQIYLTQTPKRTIQISSISRLYNSKLALFGALKVLTINNLSISDHLQDL